MAKYTPTFIGDIPIVSKFSNIIKAIDWYNGKISWRVNNVESLYFQKENQSDIGPLFLYASRLFVLSSLPNGSIKENLNQATADWDFQPRRHLCSQEI